VGASPVAGYQGPLPVTSRIESKFLKTASAVASGRVEKKKKKKKKKAHKSKKAKESKSDGRKVQHSGTARNSTSGTREV
jgi:hypothetical protein